MYIWKNNGFEPYMAMNILRKKEEKFSLLFKWIEPSVDNPIASLPKKKTESSFAFNKTEIMERR